MPATARTVDQRIYCNCGDGYWRYLVATAGLSAVQKKCPSCEEHKLVVVRNGQPIDVLDLLGHDLASVHDSLSASDEVTDSDRDLLVTSLEPYTER